MRITFNTTSVETLEYLRLVSAILRNNQNVDVSIKAYRQLKELTLSLCKRVDELERRSHVDEH